MYTLLMVAAFAAPAEAKADAPVAPKLEGKWLIVYAEEGGRRNNTWEQQQATFADNTLTFSRDGKPQTLKLTFGPHQTVKGEMTEGAKTYPGVYIAGQDYFSVSLEYPGKGDKKKEGADAVKAPGPVSGSFILILRRQKAD